MTDTPRDLVLVGAGHAHLFVVRHAAELVEAGYRVALLAPGSFHYSGVASAVAAGSLPPDAGRVDVADLAARNGVAHHDGVLADLDLERGIALADDGSEHRFDVLSLNVGSVVSPGGVSVEDGVLRVKPLDGLVELGDRIDDPALGGSARVSVVGGGASGLELAAHLAVRPGVEAVTLVEAGPTLGRDLPRGARRALTRLLARRGVDVRTGCPVSHLGARSMVLPGGEEVRHDVALLAAGLAAPPVVTRLGLGDRDGIPVRATLQHVEHDHVYAVGDCAHFTPSPLPRVGVHGVRQGPVLHRSLLARAAGRPLPAYEPPSAALAILDLGGGTGLAARGRFWWEGRASLRLKRWIDRRWLRRYRLSGPVEARTRG